MNQQPPSMVDLKKTRDALLRDRGALQQERNDAKQSKDPKTAKRAAELAIQLAQMDWTIGDINRDIETAREERRRWGDLVASLVRDGRSVADSAAVADEVAAATRQRFG